MSDGLPGARLSLDMEPSVVWAPAVEAEVTPGVRLALLQLATGRGPGGKVGEGGPGLPWAHVSTGPRSDKSWLWGSWFDSLVGSSST